MSGKSVFFINNHTILLGYRISIISIQYPTIQFNLIDKVKMSTFGLSTIDDIPSSDHSALESITKQIFKKYIKREFFTYEQIAPELSVKYFSKYLLIIRIFPCESEHMYPGVIGITNRLPT